MFICKAALIDGDVRSTGDDIASQDVEQHPNIAANRLKRDPRVLFASAPCFLGVRGDSRISILLMVWPLLDIALCTVFIFADRLRAER
jgi:hypothetical protein